MFTGLIEEIGKVTKIQKNIDGATITINCKKILQNIEIGASILTNGVCLTVKNYTENSFQADIMNESLKVTTFKYLLANNSVNLEKSLTLQSYLGGHLVTGDVDCIGKIIKIQNDGFSKKYEIELPKNFIRYVVYKGRICVDGASLTVCELNNKNFTVSLIPHTQKSIILGEKKIGDLVNIETDLIAKHIEKLLLDKNLNENKKNIDKLLIQNGYI